MYIIYFGRPSNLTLSHRSVAEIEDELLEEELPKEEIPEIDSAVPGELSISFSYL